VQVGEDRIPSVVGEEGGDGLAVRLCVRVPVVTQDGAARKDHDLGGGVPRDDLGEARRRLARALLPIIRRPAAARALVAEGVRDELLVHPLVRCRREGRVVRVELAQLAVGRKSPL
jgi:hypothetical protein